MIISIATSTAMLTPRGGDLHAGHFGRAPERHRAAEEAALRWEMLSLGGVKIPWGKPWRKPGKHADPMGIWGFSENFLDLFGGIFDRILAFDPMLWAWNGLNHQWLVIFNNQKMDIYIYMYIYIYTHCNGI